MSEFPAPQPENRVPDETLYRQNLSLDPTISHVGNRFDSEMHADITASNLEKNYGLAFRVGRYIGRRIARNELSLSDSSVVELEQGELLKEIVITPLDAWLGAGERSGLDKTEGIDPDTKESVSTFFEKNLEIGLPSQDIIRDYFASRRARNFSRTFKPTFNPDGTSIDPTPLSDEELAAFRAEDEAYDKAFYVVLKQNSERLKANDAVYEERYQKTLREDLNYADVVSGGILPQEAFDNPPTSSARYAEVLTKLKLTNPEGVNDAHDHVRGRFESMRRLVGVEMSVFADSKTWILWDIAKQEDLAKTWGQDYKGEDTSSSFTGSLLDKDHENGTLTFQAEFMRNVVAWRHFGWELHTLAKSHDPRLEDLNRRLDPYTRGLLMEPGNPKNNNQLSSAKYTDLGRRVEVVLLAESRKSGDFLNYDSDRTLNIYNSSGPKLPVRLW